MEQPAAKEEQHPDSMTTPSICNVRSPWGRRSRCMSDRCDPRQVATFCSHGIKFSAKGLAAKGNVFQVDCDDGFGMLVVAQADHLRMPGSSLNR